MAHLNWLMLNAQQIENGTRRVERKTFPFRFFVWCFIFKEINLPAHGPTHSVFSLSSAMPRNKCVHFWLGSWRLFKMGGPGDTLAHRTKKTQKRTISVGSDSLFFLIKAIKWQWLAVREIAADSDRVFCSKQRRQWGVQRLRWNKAGGGLKQMHDWAHLFDSWDFCESSTFYWCASRGLLGYITLRSILTKLLN
jgi:hypothetical protein